MNEVKDLAAQLKQLMRKVTEAKGLEAQASPDEVREMKAVMADLDKAIREGDAALSQGGVSLFV